MVSSLKLLKLLFTFKNTFYVITDDDDHDHDADNDDALGMMTILILLIIK